MTFSDDDLERLKSAIERQDRRSLDNVLMDWGEYSAFIARLEAAEKALKMSPFTEDAIAAVEAWRKAAGQDE